MKKNVVLIGCSLIMVLALAGCGNKKTQIAEEKSQEVVTTMSEAVTTEKDRGSRTEEATMKEIPLEIIIPDDIAKFGEPFTSVFPDGNLYYTIEKCVMYDNVADAGVVKTGFLNPFSGADFVPGDDYSGITDYIDAEGNVSDKYYFVLFDIHIKNENANSYSDKYEFRLDEDIVLYGEHPETPYYVTYFTEAYKANKERPMHYILEPGEELDTQAGFFVWKDDIENLVGIMNASADHNCEKYFEVQ